MAAACPMRGPRYAVNHARVADQRWIASATATVKIPHRFWSRFVFRYVFSNVRVQCFYHKKNREASDCAQSDDQHGPPQGIFAGQIIGSLEHACVRFLNRNASEQPVTGSHQKARRLRRAYTIGETICVLSGSCCLPQSRLAYARHSAACSLEIIGKQKAADGADITVRVQDRRQMPARNIENLRMVHQSDEILLHFSQRRNPDRAG